MMFCSTEANEVRFLGGRRVGAVEPIESTERRSGFPSDDDTTDLYREFTKTRCDT